MAYLLDLTCELSRRISCDLCVFYLACNRVGDFTLAITLA
jgi:hypothetical protein